MRNEEFIDICTRLYSEHKAAINAIIEHGKPKLPMTYVQEFHQRTGTESLFAIKGRNYYPFIPQEWADIVPQTSRYATQYLVAFRFEFNHYENYNIPLCLYICHFPDTGERGRFLEMLDKTITDSKNTKLTLRKSSKTTTTIYSKNISLSHGKGKDYNLADYETVIDKLVKEYNSDEVQEIFKIVDGVVKQFWGKTAVTADRIN
jgi:cupin superfamily acireductone dioxygenase involved in methionine salvage